MKDYSKVKYVKCPMDHIDLTKDKIYKVESVFLESTYFILDDVYVRILVTISHNDESNISAHRMGWMPCEENGKEIEL